MNSVSLYFSSGDFVDVLRRYDEGRDQVYHTHNEVARLYYELRAAQYRVNIYSFCTPERREERLTGGSRVRQPGSKALLLEKGSYARRSPRTRWTPSSPNFPTFELLRAAIATRS